jgi:hypothetical protein
MVEGRRGPVARWIWLSVALAAVVNSGCIVLATGAAVGGAAAATYVYMRGTLYREYHAALTDAHAAARTALMELKFGVAKDEVGPKVGESYLEGHTGDGKPIRVHLKAQPNPIPAEGPVTRISVRIGTLGDEEISKRLLDQVSGHLVPPTAAVPAPGQPIVPVAASRPIETAPPPLAK